MISLRIRVLAPALLAICAGCHSSQPTTAPASVPAAQVDPWQDQSTIEKALILSHVTGWYPQFCPPPDQMCFGTTEKARKFIGLFSDAARARESLYCALKVRFGEGGPELFKITSDRHNPLPPREMAKGMQRMGDSFLDDLQKLKIQVDGNSATIRDPGDKDGVLHAKRVDGKWMIEFPDLGQAIDDELKAADAYEMEIHQTRELTAELLAGQYATSGQAFAKSTERGKKVQALYQRLEPEAKMFLPPPSTQPSR